MTTFDELAKASPWADGRVKLGAAWDGFAFAPKEYVDMFMAKLGENGIDLVQAHVSWKPGKPSVPQAIEKLGALDSRFLMAHSNMTKEDADLYRKRGVHYSSTPSTELQMALASPVMAFRDDLGVKDLGSLGVDCHTNNAAYLPGEARIGLQNARAARGQVSGGQNGKKSLRLTSTRPGCRIKWEGTTHCRLHCRRSFQSRDHPRRSRYENVRPNWQHCGGQARGSCGLRCQ